LRIVRNSTEKPRFFKDLAETRQSAVPCAVCAKWPLAQHGTAVFPMFSMGYLCREAYNPVPPFWHKGFLHFLGVSCCIQPQPCALVVLLWRAVVMRQ
jgi:hypothetical protein